MFEAKRLDLINAKRLFEGGQRWSRVFLIPFDDKPAYLSMWLINVLPRFFSCFSFLPENVSGIATNACFDCTGRHERDIPLLAY